MADGMTLRDGADALAADRPGDNEPRVGPASASSLWRLVSSQESAIVILNGSGDATPFYCVHPISGGVTSFNGLARQLAANQPFYGIQVPRQRTRAAFASSIEAIAQYHVRALCAFQPEGPVVIGGWSAGAIVALEMAQQLRTLGRDVPLLVALDGAPSNTGAGLKSWHPLYALKLLYNLPGWCREQILTKSSVRACFRHILQRISFRTTVALRFGRNAQTLDAGSVNVLLDNNSFSLNQKNFIRAFYDAMLGYAPKAYREPVLVFEAKVQPLDHLLQVGRAWRKIANAVEVIRLDCNHETMFIEPTLTILADRLNKRLGQLHSGLEQPGRTARWSRSEGAGAADATGIERVGEPVGEQVRRIDGEQDGADVCPAPSADLAPGFRGPA